MPAKPTASRVNGAAIEDLAKELRVYEAELDRVTQQPAKRLGEPNGDKS